MLSFLCKGMTLANLSSSGNSPVSKHKLINLDNQNEKNNLKVFNITTGIPTGPVDFDGSSLSMILLISSGLVGDRKKVKPSGLIMGLPSWPFF